MYPLHPLPTQILKNFSARSTGQLSIVTYGINLFGCLARIFTTIQVVPAALDHAALLFAQN